MPRIYQTMREALYEKGYKMSLEAKRLEVEENEKLKEQRRIAKSSKK